MTWWTPDPHPCLGGCGTILQHPVGEAMSQMQSGSYSGEGEGPISGSEEERGVCVGMRESPGISRGKALRRSIGRGISGVRQEGSGRQRRRRRRDPKFVDCEICGIQDQERIRGMSSIVGPARPLWHGIRHQSESTHERKREKGLCAGNARRVPAHRGSGLCCEGCARRRDIGYHRRHLLRTEGTKGYACNAGRSSSKGKIGSKMQGMYQS